LLPQIERQPACAPLPWALKAQLAQAHADRVNIVRGHRAGGKQRHLAPRALVVHLDRLAPDLALAGVDLPEVQHLALRDATVAQAAVLHHAPVFVGLAVLDASIAAQKH